MECVSEHGQYKREVMGRRNSLITNFRRWRRLRDGFAEFCGIRGANAGSLQTSYNKKHELSPEKFSATNVTLDLVLL
jgi:hypothetical protein